MRYILTSPTESIWSVSQAARTASHQCFLCPPECTPLKCAPKPEQKNVTKYCTPTRLKIVNIIQPGLQNDYINTF